MPRLVLTIVLAAALLAGCGDSAEETTTSSSVVSDTTTTTTAPETTTTTVTETTTTTTTVETTTSTTSAETTTTTTTTTLPPAPSIEIDARPDGFISEDPPFELALVQVFLTGFTDPSVEATVNERVNAELAGRSSEIANEFVATYDPEYAEFAPSSYWVDVASFHGEDGLVSLLVGEAFYYQAAANPFATYYSQNFDAVTGDELFLEDALVADGMDDLAAEVERVIRDDLWTDPEEYEVYVPDDLTPLLGTWYVTADGLGFGFDEHEIGPGALGPAVIVVPWDRLDGIVDPGGFLGRFL